MAVSDAEKLALYNGALRLCRERKLKNLTENRKSRRLLDGVWDNDDPVSHCLEQGNWQFATRTVRLNYDTGIEPDFGFQRAFAKPDDWLRTIGVSFGEYFTDPATRFVDEAGYWYADIDELYVRYISNGNSYGLNTSLWSKTFRKFVESYLANEIVSDLTSSGSLHEKVEEIHEKRMSKAQGIDGVNRPTTFPSRGNWNASRQGRGGRYNQERYT